MTSIDSEGPYLFFGYSSGGNLAYHVARELETRGKMVSHIVMVDSGRKMERTPFTEDEVRKIAEEFLNHESVSPYLTSKILREKAYRLIQCSYAYIENSTDHHMIGADIHLVLCENSIDIHRDATGRILVSKSGWADVTRGRFETYQGSGDHNHMLDHPYLSRNVELIRRIFDRARKQS